MIKLLQVSDRRTARHLFRSSHLKSLNFKFSLFRISQQYNDDDDDDDDDEEILTDHH